MCTHVLPYVYKLTHTLTGEFYFGSRWKNWCPAELDLGIEYFTSSKIVKPIFSEFNPEIIAIFFIPEDAYTFEQQLIYEHWNNPLKLNRKYHLNTDKLWVGPSKHTELTKLKMSNDRKGKPKSDQCKLNMKLGRTGKHSRPDVSKRNQQRVGIWKSPVKGRPQPVACCPHCHKVGSVNNMQRWHFNNCRFISST